MGWRGSLLDAQLSDLLRAWDNFLAGDFCKETHEWDISFQSTWQQYSIPTSSIRCAKTEQTKIATMTGPVQTHLCQLTPPPLLLSLPMTYTPSFGAGCYGNHWHAPSRSSPDRAGNYDIAGSGSGSPSYSQYGSRSTRPGERLQGRRGGELGRRGVGGVRKAHSHRGTTCTQTSVVVSRQIGETWACSEWQWLPCWLVATCDDDCITNMHRADIIIHRVSFMSL